MARERQSTKTKETEVEAKRQEIVTLFDGIEASSMQKLDRESKVVISNRVNFLYKGEHFGLFVFKRLEVEGATRALVLTVYPGETLRPYHPPISLDIVTETNGHIVDKHEEQVKDLKKLNTSIEMLRFFAIEGQVLSSLVEDDEKPMEEVPAVVEKVAEKVWSSESMKFERARDKFFEAIAPIREKAKKVRVNKNQYRNRSGRILSGTTGWVDVEKDGKEFALRYDRVDYYMNGDWTDCDEIRMREKGIDGDGKALFIDLDIRRDYNLFSGIHNSKDVRKAVATLELLKAGLDRMKSAATRRN